MARGVKHTYLHAEAVRLRVEERKSLKEIQAQLGVSTGSLSPWLKSYPLSQDELDRKRLGKNQNRLGLSFSNTLKTRSEPSKFWSVAQNLLPHQVAHLGEAAIQFRLILNGFRSFRSSFDGDRVDFLVLAGSKSLHIQVKTILASPTKGLPVIHLTHTVGHSRKIRYTSDDIDFIVGYWVYNDTAYVYAWSEVDQASTKAISLNDAERWDKLRV